jgi:hypothetical protein
MTLESQASSAATGCSTWCMLPVGTAMRQWRAMPNCACCVLSANSLRGRQPESGLLRRMLQALTRLHCLTVWSCNVHAGMHAVQLVGLVYALQSHDVRNAFDKLQVRLPRPFAWPSPSNAGDNFTCTCVCKLSAGQVLARRYGHSAACKLHKGSQDARQLAVSGKTHNVGFP